MARQGVGMGGGVWEGGRERGAGGGVKRNKGAGVGGWEERDQFVHSLDDSYFTFCQS